jgi:hypothetical protein
VCVTRRKGEYTKARLDRESPYQVLLPANRCTGANSAAFAKFCRDLTLGPRHHSIVQHDQWHLVYCSAEKAHAVLFREIFGGERFDPAVRGRGRRWHLLRSLTSTKALK